VAGDRAETSEEGAEWFWHTVEEGETLSGVAVRHGVTARAIARANGFDACSVGRGTLGPYFARVRVPRGRPRAVAKDDPATGGRNAELVARLARLRDAEDARAYAAMTADVDPRQRRARGEEGRGFLGARASAGLDVGATMATLGLFGLAAGVRLTQDPGLRALAAVLGLVGGMFLEILRLVNQEAGAQLESTRDGPARGLRAQRGVESKKSR